MERELIVNNLRVIVYDDGRIYRPDLVVTRKIKLFGREETESKCLIPGGFYKPIKDCDGYLRVRIHTSFKNRYLSVHRLVAKAFIPNPENKPQVNHKDGNKLNNDVSNLEWVTPKENINHAWRMGLSKSHNGVPIVVGGVSYNSLTSAELATGINRHRLRRMQKNGILF